MSATYDFLTALKALTEGRCTGIKSEYASTSVLSLSATGQLCWEKGFTIPVPASPSQQWLLGQWTLVDEKREPQPWSKPEHVPFPCWIAYKGRHLLVTVISESGIETDKYEFVWGDLSETGGYSTDRINWKPCTVEAE